MISLIGTDRILNVIFDVFQATYSPYRDRIPLQIVRAEVELSAEERAYLTAVEKGSSSTPSWTKYL